MGLRRQPGPDQQHGGAQLPGAGVHESHVIIRHLRAGPLLHRGDLLDALHQLRMLRELALRHRRIPRLRVAEIVVEGAVSRQGLVHRATGEPVKLEESIPLRRHRMHLHRQHRELFLERAHVFIHLSAQAPAVIGRGQLQPLRVLQRRHEAAADARHLVRMVRPGPCPAHRHARSEQQDHAG
ncbi:MAG: hypothetical protein QM755_03135 [Luteolibacter sp.]